ncbi:MAG TPA: lipopolysaccharide biosynthesis protein [Longimicrobium sp.]|nr:lipopolysaccharide biosynthesis protein [Longimicrobium sp.]
MSVPTLAERTVRAGQWRMASWGIKTVLQLAVGVLLARLLAPAAFGLAGLAMVLIAFAQMVSELGLGLAVVQRRPLTERHLRTAFTASVVLGMAVAAALWLLAPPAARLLRTPELPPLLRALTLMFVFGALGATARATLQRALDFRRLFAVDVASYGLGYAAVAVPLALGGYGAWSLVWGSVVQAALGAALALRFAANPLRPLLARTELRELCGYGVAATLNQLVNGTARNADTLLVGRLLGPASLGLYTRAFSLMTLPLYAVGDVMWHVLLPAMAEVRDDRARLGRAWLAAVQASALAAAPLMAGLAAAAPQVAAGVYGPAWTGMAAPLQVLCIAGVFRAIYHVSGALTHATGQVVAELWRQCAFAALVVAATLAGARWGVTGVAAGVTLSIFFMYLAMARLSLRITGLRWRDFFAAQAPGAALGALVGAAAWTVAAVLEPRGTGPLAIFAAQTAAGIAAVAAGILLLPDSMRPAVLFGRLEGTVRRLPAILRLPLVRILRLSAGGA